jgi:hypothetical protein
LPPRSRRPTAPPPPPPEAVDAPDTDEPGPEGPLPSGLSEIKDQWRRYGLAEGMRKHSKPDSAGDSPLFEDPLPTPAAPPAAATPDPEVDRLTNRVLQLERALDIQAAMLRQVVARLDRLERMPAEDLGPGPAPGPAPGRDDPAPTRTRLDETWSWVRARLARGRG